MFGNSKVRNDDLFELRLVCRAEKQILWLKVSVTDILAVQVCDTLYDCLDAFGRIVFAEVMSLDDSLEQLSSRSKLKHQVVFVFASACDNVASAARGVGTTSALLTRTSQVS
jgi:hypothetical protein